MNRIMQYGNLVDYCRNTLRFSSYGTNRQATGVGGTTGREFTIYVDVEPFEGKQKSDVKLPNIGYSQTYGTWNLGMNNGPIKLGRNTKVYHDFQKEGSITVEVASGGAMYIINPYTMETQNGHVTIYFDGCYRFPLYRLGDDEESFKVILKDYYQRLMDPEDDEITIDVFEVATNYSMNSGQATVAYNTYIVENKSPKENAENWNKLFHDLLAFGGVQFNKNEPLYNEMNNHIWQNVRVVQPYAGMYAFACNEMIGLPSPDTHHNLYYLNKPGWAVSHEFGHTVDKSNRVWAENTNNMWAIYNVYHINEEVTERNDMHLVSQRLAPDMSDYVTHKDGLGLMDGDYVVWWFLEASHPGYWATYENLWITENSDKDEEGKKSILNIAERTIYYSCLALGENLTVHFDRWGYYYDKDPTFPKENRFTYAKSSDNFRRLLDEALANNRIKNTYKKAWYINLDFFNYLNKHGWKLGDWAHCYTEKDIIKPVSFRMNSAGDRYIMSLPEFKNKEAHLCYEIQSLINNEWKVMGITYTTTFEDDYNYGNSKPQYKVYGYDRNFDHSGDPGEATIPEIKPVEPIVNVCRIGETYYDTLVSAIQASQANDIIYLCKSFPSQKITVDKVLTIIPDENVKEPIVITKTESGVLITVNGNGNTKIGSKDRAKIILDGGSFQQAGALLRTQSQGLLFENVVLRNNINKEEGGGVFLGQGGQITLSNCTIENCQASGGGGINTRGGGIGSTHIILEDVLIRNNTATNNGGGICNSGTNGYSIVRSNGLILENNNANYGGGVYVVTHTEISNAIIRGNTARSDGGGVYIECDTSEQPRRGMLSNVKIFENVDLQGESAVYINKGPLHINGGVFKGRIQILDESTAKMQLDNWSESLAPTVPDFSEAFFICSLSNEGTTLFTNIASGFQLENPLNGFNVLYGYCLYENNAIIAFIGKSYITITDSNGLKYSLEKPFGEFVFPSAFEGFSEDYFIKNWALDGHVYNVGDTLYLGSNYSFEIEVEKYIILKFICTENVEVIRVKKGTNYYMPVKTPNGKRVLGWDCSDGKFYLYAQKVLVTGDLYFTPVIKDEITLTVKIGDSATVYTKKYGDTFTLPEVPPEYNNDIFKYWLVNGEKHQSGDVITISTTTTALAFYTTTFSVTFVKKPAEEVVEYNRNEVITLPYPGPDGSNKFIYWEIDNQKMYVYSTYTVNKNARIVAHYADVVEEPIKVTYKVPSVSDEEPHFVIGDLNIDNNFNYLQNLTLPDENDYMEQQNGLGFDKQTGKQVLFDHWQINGLKYEGSSVILVIESFEAVMVTRLSDEVIIDINTPTPTQNVPVITPTQNEPVITSTQNEPVITSTQNEPVITSTQNEPVITPTQNIPVITPTPYFPFMTPEPLGDVHIVDVKDGGVIETNGFNKDNVEYLASVSGQDSITIKGNGHKNFYLSLSGTVNVNKNDAHFGIKLTPDTGETTVKLNQKDPNMNIKGSGNLKLETSADVDSLSLKEATVSNDENLNVHSTVPVSLNNLNMYGNSAYTSNDKVPSKVDTITVYRGATAKIKNVEATSIVKIGQSAVISMENVDLSKVKQMTINFILSESKKAPVTGKLNAPPIEIQLVENGDTKAFALLEDKDFTIASTGKNDFASCEDWIKAVKIEGTAFNKVVCRAENDDMELVATTKKDEEEQKKKSKTPIIIGVVVAVAVVIIVVIVVVVIVVKRKKKINSSDIDLQV